MLGQNIDFFFFYLKYYCVESSTFIFKEMNLVKVKGSFYNEKVNKK